MALDDEGTLTISDMGDQIGDLDGTATIDIMDVIMVNRFLLGSISLSNVEKQCADVDGNGTINSTDSINILKYVVELIDSFDAL